MTKPVPTHDLMAQAQRELAAAFDRHLTAAGFAELSLPLGGNVLRWLGDHGQRVGDLSRLSGVSKQAISQQVRYLAEHGYVRLASDPGDARAKVVSLTERGHASHRAALAAFTAIEEELARRLGHGRLGDLRAALTAIGGAPG
ncbi:MarR family winged helix-turn-helix transcriptional regulator [Pseudonocardia acaciae]|uniref:MarR family winged helix-turn-helix transcriptional regulator n=1 Tax=Pseudonocardia acaciae TaxID=551276 RepID=UPI000685ECD6|nr:MarR family transcriptional regulator [Pseudonocardia acaciae]